VNVNTPVADGIRFTAPLRAAIGIRQQTGGARGVPVLRSKRRTTRKEVSRPQGVSEAAAYARKGEASIPADNESRSAWQTGHVDGAWSCAVGSLEATTVLTAVPVPLAQRP
jgi:hypothetical protein